MICYKVGFENVNWLEAHVGNCLYVENVVFIPFLREITDKVNALEALQYPFLVELQPFGSKLFSNYVTINSCVFSLSLVFFFSFLFFSSKQETCFFTMTNWRDNWLILQSNKQTSNNDRKETNLQDLPASNFLLSLLKVSLNVWEGEKRNYHKSYLTSVWEDSNTFYMPQIVNKRWMIY